MTGHTAKLLKKLGFKGAGDVVHALAKPVVKISDKVLKTDLAHCPSCKQRQEDWNKKISFN